MSLRTRAPVEVNTSAALLPSDPDHAQSGISPRRLPIVAPGFVQGGLSAATRPKGSLDQVRPRSDGSRGAPLTPAGEISRASPSLTLSTKTRVLTLTEAENHPVGCCEVRMVSTVVTAPPAARVVQAVGACLPWRQQCSIADRCLPHTSILAPIARSALPRSSCTSAGRSVRPSTGHFRRRRSRAVDGRHRAGAALLDEGPLWSTASFRSRLDVAP